MASLPKPDLIAYRASLRMPTSQLVEQLADILGRKLIAYICNVKDVRVVDRWIAGGTIYGSAADKLRLAFQVARTLRNYESATVVQAWMTGINPELDDQSPLRLLRDGQPEQIAPELLRAARAFIAGG